MTSLDFTVPPPDPSRPEREPRRSHRHRWERVFDVSLEHAEFSPTEILVRDPAIAEHLECVRCGAVQDPVRSRRGRTSLRAGKDAERAVAKAYPGGLRTGHLGGPDDVRVGDLFIIQSKAGAWFSERVWTELAKLPRTGGRIPTLVVSDRPGPGRRTRRYVVRMIEDDVALHGADAETTP